MYKKSEENLIQYFDKSFQKYVIIDRKTGFSSYKSVEDFQREKQKQNFCHLLQNKDINQKKTNKIKSYQKTGQCLENEVKQNSNYNNNSYEKSIDRCPEELLFSTQNILNINRSNRHLFDGFGLTSDMKIDSSIKLDKSLLTDDSLRVIGQMDRKFIVCLAIGRKLLMALDQHAVHERIRYETLLNLVFDDEKRCVKTVPVLPPINITVDCHQLGIAFDSYQTQIKANIGFELKRTATNLTHNNSYCVTQIPDCLSDSLDIDSIQEIIKEAIIIIDDKTNETNVLSAQQLTPKLLERLQTKACRGAIRFGDSLKLHDCLKLIKSLSKCKSPFRCAHGRSLIAPLAYLPKHIQQHNH